MWKKLFGKNGNSDSFQVEDYASIDLERVPKHIAIIMDGNGRWAQKKGMMRTLGHKAGVDTLKKIIKAAMKLNIKALTVYAFSTENWKRPHEEVDFLMNLFSEYLEREIDELCEDNTKVIFIGETSALSPGLQNQIENAQTRTKNNTGLILNLAVNYGSQNEITRAVKIIAQKAVNKEISIDAIDENLIDNSLDTAGSPPLDLLIRPGGDYRISNFLLWQAAYAEFWYTDINWPDFKPDDLIEAIAAYQKRDRRFGGLNKK